MLFRFFFKYWYSEEERDQQFYELEQNGYIDIVEIFPYFTDSLIPNVDGNSFVFCDFFSEGGCFNLKKKLGISAFSKVL